jgi:hypothetical protein
MLIQRYPPMTSASLSTGNIKSVLLVQVGIGDLYNFGSLLGGVKCDL